MMAEENWSCCHLVSSGGESSVYKALQSNGNVVALKVDRELRTFDPDLVEFLKTQKHRNVATLLSVDVCDGKSFSVSEYVKGVPSSMLSPIPALIAVRLLRGVALGLSHLHGVHKPHGDISPDNILVTETSQAVLIDCGITGMGAPRFAAPERFRGETPSIKSDLFSMGAVLYYWLAGEPLFGSDKFDSVADAVSRIDSYDISLLLHGKGSLSPEALGVLNPLWNGLLRYSPEDRLEDFDELDELLEIAEKNLSVPTLDWESKEKLWNVTLLELIETRERSIDARSAEFPLGAHSSSSPRISRDFLRWTMISFLVFLIAIAVFFGWIVATRKAPLDEVGNTMLQKTRHLQSDENSVNDEGDSPDWGEILMGAPTPAQEKEKEKK